MMGLVGTSQSQRNDSFAKAHVFFVKRAEAWPGFPVLQICAVAAVILMTLVGGFGTGRMPFGMRLAFWCALIGINVVLWQIWFVVTVRTSRDWLWASLTGAVMLNLPLPFEIMILLRLFGIRQDVDPSRNWLSALAISAVIFAVIIAVRVWTRPKLDGVGTIVPGALLAKAGAMSADQVIAIRAEDHYCRVFLDDGREPLVHYRFGDAIAEVASLDGARVHRSAWVANKGLKRAERNGRVWTLILINDIKIPVSSRHVRDARLKGWLARV